MDGFIERSHIDFMQNFQKQYIDQIKIIMIYEAVKHEMNQEITNKFGFLEFSHL